MSDHDYDEGESTGDGSWDPTERLLCNIPVGDMPWVNRCASRCESPIERLLLYALFSEHHFEAPRPNPPDVTKDVPIGVGRLGRNPLWMQFPIGRCFADFMVQGPAEPTARIVIECDGAAFHRATSEQIDRDHRRDAFMRREGYVVLRFPGTEIYRSPEMVMRTIYKTLRAQEAKVRADRGDPPDPARAMIDAMVAKMRMPR